MLGKIKFSAPKIIKHSTAAPKPISVFKWLVSFKNCSMKITTNIAVRTKSSPRVSKIISQANAFSASAKAKIEAAGGSCEVI